MPLPGGASDKLGNRYELRWTARTLLELASGRLRWIRIEPPGERGIEFRCATDAGQEVHQVKRSIATGGHWTISALHDVLTDFGSLLGSERQLRCVFASEHAAPELQELTERARSASDLTEFLSHFMEAKRIAEGWERVRRLWASEDGEAFDRLRRITCVTAGETWLVEDIDAIASLMFDASPAASRAALTEIALESVHVQLRSQELLNALTRRGIRRFVQRPTVSMTSTMAAPPASGTARTAELDQIKQALSAGKNTVFIEGVSGIGKTTIAASFAASWPASVCWIDCGLFATELEVLTAIAEFLSSSGGGELSAALTRGATADAAARLAGRCLGARKCLVVWDGISEDRGRRLLSAIDAIASGIAGGAQLVTQQEHPGPRLATSSAVVHVGRLVPSDVRTLLVAAYPDAGVVDLEAADRFTQGHPYLVQLLVGAASSVDLRTAMESSGTGPQGIAVSLVSRLDDGCRSALKTLAWLGVPFGIAHVSRLGGTASTLRTLADRHLIQYVRSDVYRVHDMVSELLKHSTDAAESKKMHESCALLLRGLPGGTWLELRQTLRHAQLAGLTDLAQEAGTMLLDYAVRSGMWNLVHESATSLVQHSAGAQHWYAHFLLGKVARIRLELDVAVEEYAAAEQFAPNDRDREMARYERASVLFTIKGPDQAATIFAELTKCNNPTIQCGSLVGLAKTASRRGDTEAALSMLRDAVKIAETANELHALSEAWHAMGMVYSQAQEWQQARTALQCAHDIRHTIPSEEPASRDVLGWLNLFASILKVDRELGNAKPARDAAHSMWHFSLVSGSLAWEANAAHAMCLCDPNPLDSEVATAINRLRAYGTSTQLNPRDRLLALESLVICEWALRRYETAVEALCELIAIASEWDLDPQTLFGSMPYSARHRENVVTLTDRMAGLVAPEGEDHQEFFLGLVERVLERRPELARYAAVRKWRLDHVDESAEIAPGEGGQVQDKDAPDPTER